MQTPSAGPRGGQGRGAVQVHICKPARSLWEVLLSPLLTWEETKTREMRARADAPQLTCSCTASHVEGDMETLNTRMGSHFPPAPLGLSSSNY